jgi:hypothetical protein
MEEGSTLKQEKKFRIGSLNVHSWTDASQRYNPPRIVELIKREQLDVVCVILIIRLSSNALARSPGSRRS